jgi:hypothetical protein
MELNSMVVLQSLTTPFMKVMTHISLPSVLVHYASSAPQSSPYSGVLLLVS